MITQNGREKTQDGMQRTLNRLLTIHERIYQHKARLHRPCTDMNSVSVVAVFRHAQDIIRHFTQRQLLKYHSKRRRIPHHVLIFKTTIYESTEDNQHSDQSPRGWDAVQLRARDRCKQTNEHFCCLSSFKRLINSTDLSMYVSLGY